MTRQEAAQVQIEEIMDNFDFSNVASYMKQANWTWWDCGEGKIPPTESEIRKKVREKLWDTARTGNEYFSGGFRASIIESRDERWLRLSLQFVMEYWDNEGIEYSD